MKRLMILLPLLLANCGGKGWAPAWSQASPETRLSVSPNVWTGTLDVDFYSSDGRAMTAKRLEATWGDKTFIAEDLVITERSVENREANVLQMQAAAQITSAALKFLEIAAARIPMPGGAPAPEPATEPTP